MSINVQKLEEFISKKINESSSLIDMLAFQKAISFLKTNSVSNYIDFLSLPNYIDYIGSISYVEEEQNHYVATQYGWVSLSDLSINPLYLWGDNTCGQLGNGVINGTYSSPVQEFSSSVNWAFVSIGPRETAGIKSDGTIWGWGTNTCSHVPGLANLSGSCSPRNSGVVDTFWNKVSVGANHSLGICSNGGIYGGGCNFFGVMGNNLSSGCYAFTPAREITSSTNWCDVSTYWNFSNCSSSFGIKSDGTLWGCGGNTCGSLPTNDIVVYSSPVQEITSSVNWVSVSELSALKNDGTLWSWGFNSRGVLATNNVITYSSPVQEITSSTNWCNISKHKQSVSAIKTDGTLWAWGSNGFGRIGVSDNWTTTDYSSPVQEISFSTNWLSTSSTDIMTSGIKTDGTLWSWGWNQCGQLATNNTVCHSSPVQEFTSSNNWLSLPYSSKTACVNAAIKSITL